jgi:hypothetical protein
MLRSMAYALVSATSARADRRIGVASWPISSAMRTSRPSFTHHTPSADRSRSRRASIFCLGMTVVSLGCHTRTSGRASGSALDAVSRRARAAGDESAVDAHGATPTYSRVPSSDHCGVRKRTTRRSGGRAPFAVGSSVRVVAGAAAASGQASATCVGPRRPSTACVLSTASDGASLRHARPAYAARDESSTVSAPAAASKRCTPLPTPSSVVTTNASLAVPSCHAISETLPNVASAPLASWRTTSVVPGRTCSSPSPADGPVPSASPAAVFGSGA